MFDDNTAAMPVAWREIDARTRLLGFDMPSEADTGAMLPGMGRGASLVSVDADPDVQAVARAVLGDDPRVTFVTGDGLVYVRAQPPAGFDLIFADAWPGKYDGLDETLALLRPGGLYVVDDMSPQPNWPEGHQPRVDALAARLKSHPDLTTVAMAWASGLVIAARRS
jgi:predicted O-methyltransferase YrrM